MENEFDKFNLQDYMNLCNDMAKEHGWWVKDREIPEVLCLIHSEVSEALEAYRDGSMAWYRDETGKPEGLVVELVDVLIRIFDLAGHLKMDLTGAMKAKLEYNATRPYRHGGKVA